MNSSFFNVLVVFFYLVLIGLVCWLQSSAVTITCLALSSITEISRKMKKKNTTSYRLPPGPNGLPILGNLHMLGNLPHQNLHKLSLKYGPIMCIKLGLVPAIVVSSPDMAEQCLKTHDIIFASRPARDVSEIMFYKTRGMGFTPYGSYWRYVRKICSVHLLNSSKIGSFGSIREKEVSIAVESIRLLSMSGEVKVDLTEKIGSLDGESFIPILHEVMRILGAFNVADFIPYVGALDFQGLDRRTKAISRRIDKFITRSIDDHVKENVQRQQQKHQKDIIDILLSLMNEDNDSTSQHEVEKLSRSDIKAIVLDLLIGGIDTSTATIGWALAELLRNPHVMIRLQKELETVVGMDRLVQETDLVKLEYLDMVLKETMRLHPAAPLLVPHYSMEDAKINGYDIPKGSWLMVNVWGIARNKQVWSQNAEDFYPERFIGVDIDLKGKDFMLTPFGSGRRRCPGMEMGLKAVKMILAQFVHCFEWKLPIGMSTEDLDMQETAGLTVPRAKHLIAVPKYRLSSRADASMQ
ncbi:hypothetical protein MKW92_052692 [Papaver armeniacum]|nr:hypothetical protein MKW92_052692 [Papaver armeniacum]